MTRSGRPARPGTPQSVSPLEAPIDRRRDEQTPAKPRSLTGSESENRTLPVGPEPPTVCDVPTAETGHHRGARTRGRVTSPHQGAPSRGTRSAPLRASVLRIILIGLRRRGRFRARLLWGPVPECPGDGSASLAVTNGPGVPTGVGLGHGGSSPRRRAPRRALSVSSEPVPPGQVSVVRTSPSGSSASSASRERSSSTRRSGNAVSRPRSERIASTTSPLCLRSLPISTPSTWYVVR